MLASLGVQLEFHWNQVATTDDLTLLDTVFVSDGFPDPLASPQEYMPSEGTYLPVKIVYPKMYDDEVS